MRSTSTSAWLLRLGTWRFVVAVVFAAVVAGGAYFLWDRDPNGSLNPPGESEVPGTGAAGLVPREPAEDGSAVGERGSGGEEAAKKELRPSPARARKALEAWRVSERFAWQHPTDIDEFVDATHIRLVDLVALLLKCCEDGRPPNVAPPALHTDDFRLADRVVRSYVSRHGSGPSVKSARKWVATLLKKRSRRSSDTGLVALLGYGALLGVQPSEALARGLVQDVERRTSGVEGARLVHALSLLDETADVSVLAAAYLERHSAEEIEREAKAFGQPSLARRIARGAERLPPGTIRSLRDARSPDLSFFSFIVSLHGSDVQVPEAATLRETAAPWRDDQVCEAARALLERFGSAAFSSVVAMLEARGTARTLHYRPLLGLANHEYNTIGEVARDLASGALVWDKAAEHLVVSE